MRVFLPTDAWSDEAFRISDAEAHYLRDVMRVREGARLEVFDGAGRTGEAECTALTRRSVTLRLLSSRSTPRPRPSFHLVQALAKGQKMDWILQKATELGVDVIHPVRTRHAVKKLDDRDAARKQERWEEIVRSAVRQCGRAWQPVVEPVRDLEACLARWAGPVRLLMGDLEPGAAPLDRVVTAWSEAPPDAVGLCIGPEGGWGAAEREILAAAGVDRVQFGATVLRTETAAMYGLSIFRFVFRRGHSEPGSEDRP